jgi:NitT/TauT family transport system permease protein
MRRTAVAIAVVLLGVGVVWYAAAVWLNFDRAQSLADDGAGTWAIIDGTMRLDRPLLPAPHQIAGEVWDTVTGYPISSPKSLLHHAIVTARAASAGFAIAVLLGVALAIGIVQLRALERALMPWIVASQTVPVLAIAPMVVVVLGNVGLTGLPPKAIIAGYLSFFPITLGMVQGLRSPDPMQRDLMRTYDASPRQVLTALRWPAAVPFLLPSLKLAVALALVGAIVAELPTGAQAGLGARLLAGSYYGQTLQIWAALAMAALLALLGTGLVDLARLLVTRMRGGRL